MLTKTHSTASRDATKLSRGQTPAQAGKIRNGMDTGARTPGYRTVGQKVSVGLAASRDVEQVKGRIAAVGQWSPPPAGMKVGWSQALQWPSAAGWAIGC
jgi:hypothetical protein